MSFEGSPRQLSKEQLGWLYQVMSTVESTIPADADCRSVESQVVRDLYYESTGDSVSLDDVDLLRIDMLDLSICYRVITRTALGYLCVEISQKCLVEPGEEYEAVGYDPDEPEISLICGGIFGTIRNGLQDISNEVVDSWPSAEDGIFHEGFFPHGTNILLNGRVATMGRLALRSTYTEAEYRQYHQHLPEYFDYTEIEPMTVEIDGEIFDRFVTKSIELTEFITGISIINNQGHINFFT